MPALRTTREQWVDAGLRALGAGGVGTVRVERLARMLGVTKGGFYGSFPDREALLWEMLETWERVLLDDPMAIVDAEPGDGRARMRRLFALATDTSSEMLAAELAIRDWARHEAAVADRLARVDDRRMAYMRTLYADFCDDDGDVEARCLLTATLFVGGHFVNAQHGQRSRRDVLELALAHLLR